MELIKISLMAQSQIILTHAGSVKIRAGSEKGLEEGKDSNFQPSSIGSFPGKVFLFSPSEQQRVQ